MIKRALLLSTFLLSYFLTSFAYAVEIDPMRFEHSLNAGKTYSGVFKLKNSSGSAVNIFVSTGEYRYVFSEGTRPPEKEKRTIPSCQGWFQFKKTEFYLNPGESAEAKFLVRVPKDAAQEHLCAVLFDEKRSLEEAKPKQKTGNAQVRLTPRFSIPVYISIKDTENISVEIRDIRASSESQRGGLVFTVILENTGNVHIRPIGTLTIINQSGEVAKNLPIGKCLPIFPAYKEEIPVLCPKIPAGVYSAVATIEFSKGRIIQKKSSFEVRSR